MKRFLLISIAYPPLGAVGSLRSYRMCRYLPKHHWLPEVITTNPWGSVKHDYSLLERIPHEVKVHRTKLIDPLVAFQKWTATKSPTAPAESKTDGGSRNLRENVPADQSGQPVTKTLIQRLKLTLIGLVSTPDHMVFWNLSVIAAGLKILRRNRDIRLILTSSPPHSSLIAGTVLSRIFGIPHILDMRDPWQGRYWGEHKALRVRIERALERTVIGRARYVISSTEHYTRMVRERYPQADPHKFVTITNCYEPEKLSTVEAERRSKFTMCYLGIMYPIYNPYPFFTALRHWLSGKPALRDEVEVFIVGDGDPETRRVIRDNGLEDVVTITGRIPHEEAIKIAKSADLLLLLLGLNDKVPRGCVPAKLYEYLACRRPILAHVPEGESSSIIRKTGSGYTVTSDDVPTFVQILEKEYCAKRDARRSGEEELLHNQEEIYKYSSDYTIQQVVNVLESADRG